MASKTTQLQISPGDIYSNWVYQIVEMPTDTTDDSVSFTSYPSRSS